MEYQDLKSGIRNHLNDAAEDFFMVGYFLRQISENALFTEDGYKSIWDFAKGEYGLSTSSASRFMAINARFSIDGGEHMAEKYIGMGVSKLQEMLGLPDEELEKVTQETTVREIRALKKKQEEPKSFFGLPKTVYPEGSLLSTKGCGDGKYTCFSCVRPCGIRQEERYCRTAPLGNPFSCTQMSEEKRLDIEAGLFSEKCQHLHPELAPIREGDKEPTPCCLTCEHKTCYSRCDVAKKKDEDERKKEQAELQKWQKESEGKKPDMTEKEIESLYGWLGIKPGDKITGAWLKEQHGRSYHGGGYGGDYFNCTPRGVKTDQSKEMTWAEAAKALKEIQEKKKGLADLAERNAASQKSLREALKEKEQQRKEEKAAARKAAREAARQTTAEPEDPNIIDGDFREVESSEEQPITTQEPEPVLCDTCEHEGECAGKKTHENGCMGYEEKAQELEAEAEPNPEEYARFDVESILKKEKGYLDGGREADCPAKFIKEHKILVDALTLLLEKMDAEGGAED
ncbi:hypothetical protein NSB25_12690 [Acetatifactor muris]|uniref:Uncharacterized protein n=1 Tax=Acetatifactor muris TaxID=879566 RepID=A0A2K4ZI11_9FIRM|nr:hypothetical protein [Acetatifactor muris]MCR2048145.1 hypothetical protein [Acetatifactor muris]SOY30091.1 hypothetical protein AMURIS_02814 [Acetatifactor muris]